jgi:hypothetical protein
VPYGLIGFLIPFVIGMPLLAWLGRRFARRRQREGAWDEHGPKHPTDPPIAFLKPLSSISDLRDLREDLNRSPTQPVERDREDSHEGDR